MIPTVFQRPRFTVENSTRFTQADSWLQIADSWLQIHVAHVYREVNRCVDLLAKQGYCMRVDFAIYDTPPSVELDRLLLADVNGLYYYRQIASTLASVATL